MSMEAELLEVHRVVPAVRRLLASRHAAVSEERPILSRSIDAA
jgi:hypothetical protein